MKIQKPIKRVLSLRHIDQNKKTQTQAQCRHHIIRSHLFCFQWILLLLLLLQSKEEKEREREGRTTTIIHKRTTSRLDLSFFACPFWSSCSSCPPIVSRSVRRRFIPFSKPPLCSLLQLLLLQFLILSTATTTTTGSCLS